MGLSKKQRAFIDHYLLTWNATEAAKRAGYSEKSAAEIGYENLRKPQIAEVIDKHMEANAMTVKEALGRLADMARGDLGDYMDVGGMGWHINLREAQEAGRTQLIKRVKQKTTTFLAKKESDEDREVHEIEIELHDPQAAIDKILKVAGAYKDKVDHSGEIRVLIEYANPQNNPSGTA